MDRGKAFVTQEIGSLQRPYWRQTMTRPLPQRDIDEAGAWGKRLGVNELKELVNDQGTGLLQGKEPLTPEQKKRIIEISEVYCIRMLERVGGEGLDRIGNGEQRRSEMYDYMASFVEGMDVVGWLNSGDSDSWRARKISKKIQLKEGGIEAIVDELKFLHSQTGRKVKIPLTGASTMVYWSFNEHYEKEVEREGLRGEAAAKEAHARAVRDMARNVLNPIIKALVATGIDFIIQIDEPAGTTTRRWTDILVEGFNLSVEGVPKGIEKAMHLCYTDYPALFPELTACKADTYLIETTNHASVKSFKEGQMDIDPSALRFLELIREHNMSANVGVGVIDNHSNKIETPESVSRIVLHAAEILEDPKRVQVNPDCGLRTRSLDVAYEKLASMVRGVRIAKEALERKEAEIAQAYSDA